MYFDPNDWAIQGTVPQEKEDENWVWIIFNNTEMGVDPGMHHLRHGIDCVRLHRCNIYVSMEKKRRKEKKCPPGGWQET
jgi:hypothetical protein